MIRNNMYSLMASSALAALMAPADEGARGTGAGGPKPRAGQQATDSVETGSGQSGFSGSLSMDVDGDKVSVSEQESTVDHIEVGAGADEPTATEPEADADGGPAGGDDADGDDEGEKTVDDDKPTDFDVPEEFKADDPEVVAKFDAAFKSEDGKLKMDALSTMWWANAQASEDGVGSLTEATYSYLDHLGIPKELVQATERGQQALNSQAVQSIYATAGGKAHYDAAVAWAARGDNAAYSAEQQEAFNKALDKGGTTAQDAVDLLVSRYQKASGTARTSPGKSAGEHATGGDAPEHKANTFKTRDEWLAARKEAGRDQAKQAAVSKMYRASPGANTW